MEAEGLLLWASTLDPLAVSVSGSSVVPAQALEPDSAVLDTWAATETGQGTHPWPGREAVAVRAEFVQLLERKNHRPGQLPSSVSTGVELGGPEGPQGRR